MAKDEIMNKKSKTKDGKEEKEKKEESSIQFQFNDEEQNKIIQMIIDDYNTDKSARTEFNARLEEILFLFEGKRESKSDPWPNCSNVNTMLTAVACEIVHSKLLPTIWNEDNMDWRCEDVAFGDNAHNIRKFMKWATREVEMGKIVDDLTYDSVLLGTTVHKIRKTISYKWVQRKVPDKETIVEKAAKAMGIPVEKKYKVKYEYIQDIRREIDSINLEDFYFPYYAKDEQECDHLIHRFFKTYPEALDLETRNYWKNVKAKLKDRVDEIVLEGKTKEDMDSEGMAKVESLRDNKPLMFIEWYGDYDWNKDGILEKCVFVIQHSDSQFGGKGVYISGKPLTTVSRIEKRPFVVGQYIRRSNRLLGKGVAHLVANLQKHIDSFYNQKNDAGTLSLIPFGVYTPASGFDPDEVTMSPGSWYPVDDVSGIQFVTIPNNTGATWEDIRFLISIIERLTSATPYQQGRESDVVKSGATATATIALIQEGQSMFVKTANRLARTVAKISEALLQSYQEDMPPGLAERVTGEHGENLFPEGISPEDIAGRYHCYLNIDTLSFNKSVRRSVDLQLYQFFMANPIVMSNPGYVWELSAMVLKALEKKDNDIEKIIGPRPNLTYAELNDAKEENIQMLAGRKVDIDMNEPLFEHLITHLAFRSTQVYKEMEPEKQALVEEHIEDTKLALTMQMRTMQAQMQGGEGGEQTGQIPQGVSAGGVPGAPTVKRMGALSPETFPGGEPIPGATGQGAAGGQPGAGTVLPR